MSSEAVQSSPFGFSDSCCSLPPLVPAAQYQAKGRYEQLTVDEAEPFSVYVAVGSNDADKAETAIFLYYDIFGYHPNFFQICDLLATQLRAKGHSVVVVMPDVFRGAKPPGPAPSVEAKANPPSEAEVARVRAGFMAFTQQHGDWNKVVRPATESVVKFVKARFHVKHTASMGFCWGAIPSLSHSKLPEVHSVGVCLVHPSRVDAELMATIEVPVCALPSKTEPDYVPIMATLDQKPFHAACVHVRFDDMHHGWCGARGDWSDPVNGKRAHDAVSILVDFLDKRISEVNK